MFSKSLVFFVLASSAVSAFAASPVAVVKEDCPSVTTRTVTVQGRAAETGAALVATGGSADKGAAAAAAAKKGKGQGKGKGKAGAAKGTADQSAAAKAAAAKAAAAKAAAAKGAADKGTGDQSAAAKAAAAKAAAAKAAAAKAAAGKTANNGAAGKAKGTGAALADAGKAGDLQTQLTLDPGQIATGFLNNGQAVQEAGQVPSITSGNNFINFCASTKLPITNGKQITTGSCNPAIIGQITSIANMPSAKFQFPTNFATIKSNSPFTISMAISNLETGNFVNAQQNYFSAPQQLNAQGQIIGHSHVVIEAINGLAQTTPTDPTKFAFFKGLNAAAVGGLLSADVVTGLPAGTYRMSSINTAANHQPAIVPVAQHGSLDDAVYFTVADNGTPIAAANAPKAAAGKRSVFVKEHY